MAIRSHGGDYVVARLCVAFVVGAVVRCLDAGSDCAIGKGGADV